MPQPQRRARVLDAVVGLVLNVLLEQVPGQKAKAEPSLPCSDVEQIHRVEHLRFRNVDVDRAEVFREAVAYENDAEVEQQPKLLVCHFQADQCMRAEPWIEISRLEARVLGQMVDHRLRNGDVVIDEWNGDIGSTATQHGHAPESQPRWTDDLTVASGGNFDFFGAKGHKLGVDGDRAARAGCLGCRS